MADFGFWAMAARGARAPGPGGPRRDRAQGGRAARPGQPGRPRPAAARAAARATRSPSCCPTASRCSRSISPPCRPGWYIVPINHHLVAPEIAYILKDSGAAVFIGHERFADICLDAAEEAEIPASRCLAVGDIPGFASYGQLRDNQKTDLPDDRSLGDTMNYTSGTTGNPKGVRRTLSGADPDDAAIGLAGILLALRHPAPRRQRPHRGLAALPHGRPPVLGGGHPHGPHRGADGQVDRRGDARAHRAVPGDPLPHGPHPVPPTPRPARGRPEQVRPVLAPPHDPRRRPLPGRHQARHDRVVGARDRRVLRRLRGRGHHRQHRGVAARSRARWASPGPSRRSPSSTTRRTGSRPNQIGTVYMAMQSADFEYHKDKEKTQKNRIGKFFTVGDVGYLDDDGFLFLCDRKTDMIISGGRQHLPGRDRERASRATPRSSTPRSSASPTTTGAKR